MRFYLVTAFVVLVHFSVAPVKADEEADKVIEFAIKARCQKPEMLGKQRTQLIEMEGKIFDGATTIPAVGRMQIEGRDRFRWDLDLTLPQGKKQSTLTLMGGTAWQRGSDTPPRDMTFSERDEFMMEIHAHWLSTLYPLRDKYITLKKEEDATLNEEKVFVIKAKVRALPEVTLYVSQKSGNLLMVAYKAREQGVDMRKEHWYADYKSFQGLTLPAKLTDMKQLIGRPSLKAAEWDVKDYKFVDKLGDDVFVKPEK